MTRSLLVEELRARGELLLKIKVVPRSSRGEIAGVMADGTVKIRVQAPPEKGKANAEVCSVLAREFNVSPRNVRIVSGHASPLKRVRVAM